MPFEEAELTTIIGISYGITPLVETYDYLTGFMILFGIFTGVFALGIPVYFLNPKVSEVRGRRTATPTIYQIADGADSGSQWREFVGKKQLH
jgi:hypothetical protein